MQVLFHGIGGYGANEAIGRACWPHNDVIVVLSGTVHFTLGDMGLSCAAGHALHIAPHTSFSGVSGISGCRLWVQHFALTREDHKKIPALSESGCFERQVEGDWLKSLRLRIEKEHRECDAVALPHLLFLFLRDLGRVQSQSPGEGGDPGVVKMRTMREDLKNQPHPLPTVDALAERLGWSRTYFSARFKECFGEGPGTFLRSLRTEQAGRLLRETCLPIKVISHRLGYADPVAFHRAFRQAYGITPSKWRNGVPRVI